MKNFIPIQKSEFVRFMSGAVMILTIIYMHHLLRLSKDTLIISNLGTETISAIKTWLVLPSAMIFMVIYMKLSDLFNRTSLFYLLTWGFMIFFASFIFIIYPNSDRFIIDINRFSWLQISSLKYLIKIIQYWHYSLFFIMSELFITTIYSISFWQLMNHITTIQESKRFYPLFGLASQFGLMLAGVSSKIFINASVDWQHTLNKIGISILVAAIILTISMKILSIKVGRENINSRRDPKIIKSKEKISLKESIKYIFNSKPILLITSLILCYNIAINLVEGAWKKSTELYFAADANLIQNFISTVIIYISITTILSSLATLGILRYCKWKTAALIPPAITIVIGTIFFLLLQFRNHEFSSLYGISALQLVMYAGALYYTTSRALKNTLFDSTKEMAYIPLPDILQTKGKAAAETIGIRLGKGSGGFIQQILLMIFANMTLIDLAPFFSIIFIGLMVLWIFSVISLNRFMQKAHA